MPNGNPGIRRGRPLELDILLKRGASKQELLDWVFANSMPEPNTGCHIWMGTLTGKNYPCMVDVRKPFNRKSPPRMLLHRFVCELEHGPLPDIDLHPRAKDTLSRHRCDNPSCVNPEHILPGTHQDNCNDKIERSRFLGLKGVLNGRAKLNEDNIRELRSRRRFKGSNISWAKEFDVAPTLISQICRNTIWRHVT